MLAGIQVPVALAHVVICNRDASVGGVDPEDPR